MNLMQLPDVQILKHKREEIQDTDDKDYKTKPKE